MRSTYVKLLALTAAGALLGGCGGDSPGTGQLRLALTDAPVDEADAVVVAFTGIEVKPADGPAFLLEEFDPPMTVDLLGTQDGVSVEIANTEVEAGRYNWIRLAVALDDDGVVDPAAESYITIDGIDYPLGIPSGAETGLKLVSGFIVPQGGLTDFTVDFDLRKSVNRPMSGENTYILRPALRIVDNTVVGSIAGTVDANLVVGDGSTCAVYVFEGSGVTPDDVDGSDPEPLTTAGVKLDLLAPGEWGYRAAFLLPETYTVALTCETDQDEASEDNPIAFSDPQEAAVAAGEETPIHFGP